jgi:DNA transformation protein
VSGFVEHCRDLLSSLGEIRARAMMGGHILYAGELPIALVYEERLYLKSDPASREAYAAAGGEPFTYELRGRVVEMSYWSAPESALDDPEAMRPWAERAIGAALRAQAAKRAKKRKTSRPAPRRPSRGPKSAPRTKRPGGSSRRARASTRRS